MRYSVLIIQILLLYSCSNQEYFVESYTKSGKQVDKYSESQIIEFKDGLNILSKKGILLDSGSFLKNKRTGFHTVKKLYFLQQHQRSLGQADSNNSIEYLKVLYSNDTPFQIQFSYNDTLSEYIIYIPEENSYFKLFLNKSILSSDVTYGIFQNRSGTSSFLYFTSLNQSTIVCFELGDSHTSISAKNRSYIPISKNTWNNIKNIFPDARYKRDTLFMPLVYN